MASEGYPGSYERGLPIRGLDEAAKIPDVKVFHSGTATVDGQMVTNGGRVLAVTALGSTIAAAKLQAYTAVKCIRWQRRLVPQRHLRQGPIGGEFRRVNGKTRLAHAFSSSTSSA